MNFTVILLRVTVHQTKNLMVGFFGTIINIVSVYETKDKLIVVLQRKTWVIWGPVSEMLYNHFLSAYLVQFLLGWRNLEMDYNVLVAIFSSRDYSLWMECWFGDWYNSKEWSLCTSTPMHKVAIFVFCYSQVLDVLSRLDWFIDCPMTIRLQLLLLFSFTFVDRSSLGSAFRKSWRDAGCITPVD